jgi:CubicO group peptidase (beta-lactamase class C family)
MLKTTLVFTLFLFSNSFVYAQDETNFMGSNSVPQAVKNNDIITNIKRRMKYYGVPGASIVVIKNREVLWSQSFGVKDFNTQKRVDSHTLFQAASISKTLTAAIALKFAQEKRLDINEEANSYLINWKIPRHKYSKYSPILVKQIINHTSGLSVHGFAGYKVEEPIPSLIEVLNGSSWGENLFYLKKANSAPVKVVDKPGNTFKYSGGGYSVLQQLLIDNEQSDFVTIMKENIFKPLNMTHSTYQQPIEGRLSLLTATGHPAKNEPLFGKYHIYPEQAAAGLWTTSEDLAKFLIDIQSSLLNGEGQVLSKKTAEKMVSPTVSLDIGFGFFLKGLKDKGYFYHDGRNEGFSSTLLGHKLNGYGVIILTNANQQSVNREIVLSLIQKYNWEKI